MTEESGRELAIKFLRDDFVNECNWKIIFATSCAPIRNHGRDDPIYDSSYDKDTEVYLKGMRRIKDRHVRKNYSEEEAKWLKQNMNY